MSSDKPSPNWYLKKATRTQLLREVDKLKKIIESDKEANQALVQERNLYYERAMKIKNAKVEEHKRTQYEGDFRMNLLFQKFFERVIERYTEIYKESNETWFGLKHNFLMDELRESVFREDFILSAIICFLNYWTTNLEEAMRVIGTVKVGEFPLGGKQNGQIS